MKKLSGFLSKVRETTEHTKKRERPSQLGLTNLRHQCEDSEEHTSPVHRVNSEVLVSVPPGAVVGSLLHVETPQGLIAVNVPEGAREGETFRVQLPRRQELGLHDSSGSTRRDVADFDEAIRQSLEQQEREKAKHESMSASPATRKKKMAAKSAYTAADNRDHSRLVNNAEAPGETSDSDVAEAIRRSRIQRRGDSRAAYQGQASEEQIDSDVAEAIRQSRIQQSGGSSYSRHTTVEHTTSAHTATSHVHASEEPVDFDVAEAIRRSRIQQRSGSRFANNAQASANHIDSDVAEAIKQSRIQHRWEREWEEAKNEALFRSLLDAENDADLDAEEEAIRRSLIIDSDSHTSGLCDHGCELERDMTETAFHTSGASWCSNKLEPDMISLLQEMDRVLKENAALRQENADLRKARAVPSHGIDNKSNTPTTQLKAAPPKADAGLVVGKLYAVTRAMEYNQDEPDAYTLPKGLVGRVETIDEDGDAELDFGPPLGKKYVLKDDHHLLKLDEADHASREKKSNALLPNKEVSKGRVILASPSSSDDTVGKGKGSTPPLANSGSETVGKGERPATPLTKGGNDKGPLAPGKGKGPPAPGKGKGPPAPLAKGKGKAVPIAVSLPLGRKWHWRSLLPDQHRDTVFEHLIVDGEAGALTGAQWHIDTGILKSLFTGGGGAMSRRDSIVEPKEELFEVTIFDAKRAQNLQIGLMGLRNNCQVEVKDLAAALTSLDVDAQALRNPEVIELATTLLPSSEEVRALVEVPESESKQLRDVERNIRLLARIPRLPQRLRLVFFARKVADLEADVRKRIAQLQKGTSSACKSRSLQLFLGVCLSIGCFVNHGFLAAKDKDNSGVPVGGFRLSSLPRLREFHGAKRAGGAVCLLHVVLLHLARLLEDTESMNFGESASALKEEECRDAPQLQQLSGSTAGASPKNAKGGKELTRRSTRREIAGKELPEGIRFLKRWHDTLKEELVMIPEIAKNALVDIVDDIREIQSEAAFVTVEASTHLATYEGAAAESLQRLSVVATECVTRLWKELESAQTDCTYFCVFFGEKVGPKPEALSEVTQALLSTLAEVSSGLIGRGLEELCRFIQTLPAPSALEFNVASSAQPHEMPGSEP